MSMTPDVPLPFDWYSLGFFNIREYAHKQMMQGLAEFEWNLLMYGNHGLPYPRYNHMMDMLKEGCMMKS